MPRAGRYGEVLLMTLILVNQEDRVNYVNYSNTATTDVAAPVVRKGSKTSP